MTTLRWNLLASLCILFMIACKKNNQGNGQNGFKDCPGGTPKAIFDEKLEKVEQHSFKLKANSSTETAKFANNVHLQIYQTGCEKVSQEFQFTLLGDHSAKKTSEWVDESIALFRYMSAVSPQHMMYNQWAEAILGIKPSIKIGEKMEIAAGFYLTLNKISNSEQSFLIVKLSQ